MAEEVEQESTAKSFKGIINKLPKGYTPKIKIIINKLEKE